MPQAAILCVDDEKLILDSLEDQLQYEFGAEFTILMAESCEEALELITDCRTEGIEIAVILADYLLPGMKGDQFLIRTHAEIPETRKIMLTGQAGLEAVVAAINQANLYRYLAKPWEKNDLLLTVREAIFSLRQEQTIKLQNADLHRLNLGLEEQVAARTRELNQQKDLFSAAFHNSPDAMLIFDADLKIMEVNAAFETIFQYPAAAVQGCRLPETVTPAGWRDDASCALERVLSGQTVLQEAQCRKQDGMAFPVSLIAYPMATGGERQGGVAVYRDLSAERETADLLRRSYERRRRNHFFNELIHSKGDLQEDGYHEAKLLGMDLKGSFLIMFLSPAGWSGSASGQGEAENEARMLLEEISDWLSDKPGIYTWGRQEGIGVIHALPEDYREDVERDKQIAAALMQTVAKKFPGKGWCLGLAEHRPGMTGFADRYQQARLAALIGARMHPDFPVHHYWDIGAFPLLVNLVDDGEAERFLERTIGKLLQHDRKNGTCLMQTLERILDGANLRKVADEMFIHYKTLLFRKRTIEKILAVSLDSFEGRTLIGTAMTLYYFREMKAKV